MRRKLFLVPILTFVLFILSACQPENSSNSSDSKTINKTETINIVATTAMIADAIENLVGDWAKVTSLMGPGVDPHLYKATQGDLTKLQKADLIFYNGMYLEGKMEDVLERLAKKKPVKAITDNIPASRRLPLEEDGHTVTDPHVWFDVKLWESGVSTIVKKLVTLYPKHEGEIEDNAKAYIQKLDALHEQVKSEIANIPVNQRILITSHDAFGYFERAYNIEVKALQGLSTVTEFGLKDLTNLVNLITEKKIPAIFVESSVASKPMEAIVKGCKEKGHDVKIGGVLYSDAMGEYGTKEGTYLGMVEHNLRTITQALK